MICDDLSRYSCPGQYCRRYVRFSRCDIRINTIPPCTKTTRGRPSASPDICVCHMFLSKLLFSCAYAPRRFGSNAQARPHGTWITALTQRCTASRSLPFHGRSTSHETCQCFDRRATRFQISAGQTHPVTSPVWQPREIPRPSKAASRVRLVADCIGSQHP